MRFTSFLFLMIVSLNLIAQDPGDPMPVELSDFKFDVSETGLDVLWETEIEINNDYFDLQISENGTDWTNFDRVIGTGSNSDYSVFVPRDKLFANLNYFRLVQYDTDGTKNIHRVIVYENSEQKFEIFDYMGNRIGVFDSWRNTPKNKIFIYNGRKYCRCE